MRPELLDSPRNTAEVELFLSQVAATFAAKPFTPQSPFQSGHAQTLAAYAWPRRYRFNRAPADEVRLFEINPDVKVMAHCRWQPDRQKHSTILIWHGMEG